MNGPLLAFVGLLNKEQKSIKQRILKIVRALFAELKHRKATSM